MTATELQGIVRRLANSCWCRYWLNYNSTQNHVIMAIQCLEWTDDGRCGRFAPVGIGGLAEPFGRGFRRLDDSIYVIDRTNDDGTPFVSQL